MGNIISSEERLLRHSREELTDRRKLHRISWTDRELGYHSKADPSGRETDPKPKTKKRTVSFYSRNEKGDVLKPKSQSLNAIFEELYLARSEDRRHIEKEGTNLFFGNKRTFIPRIKLTRSASSLKVEKRHKPILNMSVKSEILDVPDLGKSLGNIYMKSDGKHTTDYNTIDIDNSSPYSKSGENLREIRQKPDENYFAKNFDECMKRLQLIEREHEKIEKDESNIRLFSLRKNSDRKEIESANIEKIPPRKDIPLFDLRSENCYVGNPEGKGVQTNESVRIKVEVENRMESTEGTVENPNNTVTFKTSKDGVPTKPGIIENDDINARANQELISTWYSNLKQQFEKSEKEEQKNKEMSCRITGATLKNSQETVKQEEKDKNTRHYFSRLVKSNKSLIDEELPDPDKVKNIRAMFQENLNSTLKRRLHQKLGGSLQNICSKTSEQQMTRPLSAQCNRDEVLAEIREDHKLNEGKVSGTETVAESLKDSDKDFQSEISKRKLFEKYDKDLKMGRDFRARKFLQPKWTDTGSVSSGVSSDLSSYDTDLESYSREGVEPEQDEITISDEDVLEEVQDKHYVQNEILEKIRSFGTSVTYYGGEMVTCSVGPLLSPTTQAIMEEIGEKHGHETRSFHEFYKKYVEANEPTRKKKIGRTRSFGQYDVFQKPNVLSNTEIEMYKDDLEAEIGLRKPTGMSPNGLKMKVYKSNSVGSSAESTGKPIPEIIEPVTEDETAKEEQISMPEEPNLKEVSNERVIYETKSEGKLTENLSQNETCDAKLVSESEKEIYSNNQTQESKKKEETETSQSAIARKEYLIERSQSAPEGLLSGSISTERNHIKPSELPSKEILFGYEKSLFNGQRKQDMEFEEFEVCETVSEKLEKLDEKNSSEYQSTSKSNEDLDKVEANEITNEEFSKKTETPTDKVLKVECTPKRKWNINLNEENGKETNSNSHTKTTTNGQIENTFEESKNQSEPITGTAERKLNGQTQKKFTKNNQSRWPIETSVMVDIQRNNEQTPKIVTNGKTFAKTKIRLF